MMPPELKTVRVVGVDAGAAWAARAVSNAHEKARGVSKRGMAGDSLKKKATLNPAPKLKKLPCVNKYLVYPPWPTP
jgi:hypothetical protein